MVGLTRVNRTGKDKRDSAPIVGVVACEAGLFRECYPFAYGREA